MTAPSIRLRRNAYVTPAQVRAEGFIDVGQIGDLPVLWIRTEVKLRLMHVDCLRRLQPESAVV